MQKTQILKLNTSKDNVDQFFNKVKDKLNLQQGKSKDIDDYDITMIVKHREKPILSNKKKQQVQNKNDNNDDNSNNDNDSDNNNDQQLIDSMQQQQQQHTTLKSIFSQLATPKHNNNQQNLKQLYEKQSNNQNTNNNNNANKEVKKQVIYDENMHIQSQMILGRNSSNKLQQQHNNNINSNNSNINNNNSSKIRKSNIMPNENAMFKFKKKSNQTTSIKKDIQNKQQKSIKKNNNFINNNSNNSNKDHNNKQEFSLYRQQEQQEHVQQQSSKQYTSHQQQQQSNKTSDNDTQQQNSSITSEQQQKQQQQLKKHVSHRHIDIFPNIEINNVVSQKLMSLKSFNNFNMNNSQNKKNTLNAIQNNNNKDRRRCSINDQNLLSPRIQSIFNQQIKHQSTKQINNLLKKDNINNINNNINNKQSSSQSKQPQQKITKNSHKNKLYKIQIDDGIKEDQLSQQRGQQSMKQRRSSTSIKDRCFENKKRQNIKNINNKKKRNSNIKQQQQQHKLLARPQVRYKSRQRTSALAKKSIFQQQQQQQSQPHHHLSQHNHQHHHNEKHSKNKIQFNIQNNNQANEFIITVPQIPHHPIIDQDSNQQNLQQEEQQEDEQQSQQQSNSSSNQQQQDSIYMIQNKLNNCIQLIEKNQIFKLEDYLYEFKNKYNYVTNTKILIKWRLMMAHCKQTKKQFERAAINYNSVIQLAKDNPKCLTIQPAQVYHRLGVCYSEIAQYNKGILAFTQALNRYKRAKNPLKYAQCINNLGTLYLQAQSLGLAQKCFLQSYHLKKSINDEKSNTKLLTSLFNIFQCNLLMKNYDQAQKIITVIENEIINNLPQNQTNKLLYLGGLYRRKGKMQFLRGNIKSAQQNYLKSFESLSNRYPYCMQFGELMSCLGMLKLEEKKYKQAKQYYDKAIMLMNFYCPKDSTVIHLLKRNLQYAVKMIAQEKQKNSSRQSFFD